MSLLSPQLQAFIAICKQKTVHGAANEIHITQTAVTQRIHTLEKSLGTTLFVRSRRGMMLTPEGEALLHYCQAAIDLEGEALAKIRGTTANAQVRICLTGPTSIMRSRIIPQITTVVKKFDNVLFTFAIRDHGERVSSLRSGDSQFAIIEPGDIAREMDYKLLEPERYILVCSSQWKNRELEEIIRNERIIDYDPDDQMTFNYLKKNNLFDYARRERHFANRTESLAELIVCATGYGLLSIEFSRDYLKRKELIMLNDGKIFEHLYALAWYKRPNLPKYFAAIIDQIN